MKLLSVVFLAALTISVYAQTTFPLPKSAPKFSMNTKNIGPKPGSPASESAPETAQFKRIYAKPAQLRMLVRAKCDTRVGNNALITRAKSNSLPTGPVVQMDWERIRGDQVAFYFVASFEKEIVTVEMKKQNGKYVATSTKRDKVEKWQTQQVSIPSQKSSRCIDEKKITQKEMRVAAINFLNNATLRNFRNPLDTN